MYFPEYPPKQIDLVTSTGSEKRASTTHKTANMRSSWGGQASKFLSTE